MQLLPKKQSFNVQNITPALQLVRTRRLWLSANGDQLSHV